MSKNLSQHSNLRQSGNSLVVTVPHEIVKDLMLKDGDSVFWRVLPSRTALNLSVVRLEEILKGGDEEEELDEEIEEEVAPEEEAAE